MAKTTTDPGKLPRRFDALVALMPPRAIDDDVQYENTLEMIDHLMALPTLSKGQQAYLETLVQLTTVYEAAHHAIDTADLDGIDALQHLLDQHDMSASDLARLLGVHPSMGSKILNRQRALTLDHIKTLAEHFHVSPELFIGA